MPLAWQRAILQSAIAPPQNTASTPRFLLTPRWVFFIREFHASAQSLFVLLASFTNSFARSGAQRRLFWPYWYRVGCNGRVYETDHRLSLPPEQSARAHMRWPDLSQT